MPLKSSKWIGETITVAMSLPFCSYLFFNTPRYAPTSFADSQ